MAARGVPAADLTVTRRTLLALIALSAFGVWWLARAKSPTRAPSSYCACR